MAAATQSDKVSGRPDRLSRITRPPFAPPVPIRRWPPHVNVLFGFVPEADFEQAAPTVTEALSAVAPFTAELRGARWFRHRLYATVWLDPAAASPAPSARLYGELVERFPRCHNRAHGFTPHVRRAGPGSHAGWPPTVRPAGQPLGAGPGVGPAVPPARRADAATGHVRAGHRRAGPGLSSERGCTWRQLPPVFGPAGPPSTGDSPSGAGTGSGPGCTASSSTSSALGRAGLVAVRSRLRQRPGGKGGH